MAKKESTLVLHAINVVLLREWRENGWCAIVHPKRDRLFCSRAYRHHGRHEYSLVADFARVVEVVE